MNSIISPSLTSKPTVVNGPKVGDILCSTYGYEACIANFAKVVAVTKASVKIVRLGVNEVYTGGGGLTWDSTPNLNAEGSEVETKRFSACGETYRVKNTSFSNYYPWSGKPVSCYNYH